MRRALLLLAVFAAGLALALGGCGGGYGDDKPAGTNGTTTSDDGYSRYGGARMSRQEGG